MLDVSDVMVVELENAMHDIENMLKSIATLERELDAKQAKIDELMLEYCPDEITDEQWEEYRKHQVPVKWPEFKWMTPDQDPRVGDRYMDEFQITWVYTGSEWQPVIRNPEVDLTDDELRTIWETCFDGDPNGKQFARAVIAAYKEKNK